MRRFAVLAMALAACAHHATPPPASPPRIDRVVSEGTPPSGESELLARAVAPLRHCLPESGGKLSVRVTRTSGTLRVTFEPDASLDPFARACATDALLRVYEEETASNVGGPAVPATGFTSLLVVSW